MQKHNGTGGRKLYELIEPFKLRHQIKMGRDALFDQLGGHGLVCNQFFPLAAQIPNGSM
ncbi:MAG: hypothetical protein WD267_12965 [Balneolales bacterium]